MTKIPENSDSTESPDDLQQTNFSCGHDGCNAEFETAGELANHTTNCPHNPHNEEG